MAVDQAEEASGVAVEMAQVEASATAVKGWVAVKVRAVAKAVTASPMAADMVSMRCFRPRFCRTRMSGTRTACSDDDPGCTSSSRICSGRCLARHCTELRAQNAEPVPRSTCTRGRRKSGTGQVCGKRLGCTHQEIAVRAQKEAKAVL